MACRRPLCTVLSRSLYELVLRFHCYIGQQERDLETSKMKHLLTKKNEKLKTAHGGIDEVSLRRVKVFDSRLAQADETLKF